MPKIHAWTLYGRLYRMIYDDILPWEPEFSLCNDPRDPSRRTIVDAEGDEVCSCPASDAEALLRTFCAGHDFLAAMIAEKIRRDDEEARR